MSIAENFERCLRDFKRLCEYSKSSHESTVPNALHEAFVEQLGRFRVWAANVAAHRTGQSSLDYRLRDASHLRNTVRGYISSINDYLVEARVMLVKTKLTFALATRMRMAAEQNDQDSDEEAGPEDLIKAVSILITCLIRLSYVIREPAAHDQFVNTANIDTSFFETHDIHHVQSKFPDAEDVIVRRLGKAISRRRHYLKYREDHGKKLSQGVAVDDDGNTIAITESTIASTLPDAARLSNNRPTIYEFDSESIASDTTYATSAYAEGRLQPPAMPESAKNGDPFECCLCHLLITVTNPQAWKKHVFRDLRPYLCTYPDCADGDHIFESRHKWVKHELLWHESLHICPQGCQEPFKSPEKLEDHLVQTHSILRINVRPFMLASLQSAKSNLDEPRTVCPLCTFEEANVKKLQQHIARHQEELALFAIPLTADDLTPKKHIRCYSCDHHYQITMDEQEIGCPQCFSEFAEVLEPDPVAAHLSVSTDGSSVD